MRIQLYLGTVTADDATLFAFALQVLGLVVVGVLLSLELGQCSLQLRLGRVRLSLTLLGQNSRRVCISLTLLGLLHSLRCLSGTLSRRLERRLHRIQATLRLLQLHVIGG
jgi:hypothetical protein